jgi:hypothetical protein
MPPGRLTIGMGEGSGGLTTGQIRDQQLLDRAAAAGLRIDGASSGKPVRAQSSAAGSRVCLIQIGHRRGGGITQHHLDAGVRKPERELVQALLVSIVKAA